MRPKNKEIPFSMPYIDEREIKEVVKVLRGKWITSGSEVKKFEAGIKNYLDVKSAIAVSSGTAALEISLAVHNVGPGDQVLTTAYTFASTALVIIHRGAEPVFVDIEPETFNISPSKIEELIQQEYQNTAKGLKSKKNNAILKGIIAVHFAGQPAEIEKINQIAKKYNLFVIEDAAHAIGATHKGKKLGKSSNLVCFSFYSNKNVTTGEGGMIVTDNDVIEKKLRMYSLHGISKNAVERYKKGLPFYDIIYPGYKANLTDIQAALGVVQVKKINRITQLRNRIAEHYDTLLDSTDGIQIPIIHNYNYSARHLYPILLIDKFISHRDEIIVQLRYEGIYPSVHFIPVHFHTFFKNYLKDSIHLPVTEELFHREISLPLFPGLKKSEVKYVAETLKKILNKFK